MRNCPLAMKNRKWNLEITNIVLAFCVPRRKTSFSYEILHRLQSESLNQFFRGEKANLKRCPTYRFFTHKVRDATHVNVWRKANNGNCSRCSITYHYHVNHNSKMTVKLSEKISYEDYMKKGLLI